MMFSKVDVIKSCDIKISFTDFGSIVFDVTHEEFVIVIPHSLRTVISDALYARHIGEQLNDVTISAMKSMVYSIIFANLDMVDVLFKKMFSQEQGGLKSSSGNAIYTMLVDSYAQWSSISLKEIRGYSQGITQICLSRQMGHTTAITQLFNENWEDSVLFSVAPTKYLMQKIFPFAIPERVVSVQSLFNKTVDMEKFSDVKFIMFDMCNTHQNVRDSAIKEICSRNYKNLQHIFIVQ